MAEASVRAYALLSIYTMATTTRTFSKGPVCRFRTRHNPLVSLVYTYILYVYSWCGGRWLLPVKSCTTPPHLMGEKGMMEQPLTLHENSSLATPGCILNQSLGGNAITKHHDASTIFYFKLLYVLVSLPLAQPPHPPRA